MFKLLLTALIAYLGYSLYIRFAKKDRIHRSKKSTKTKKYSQMDISDADFKDIDED